ncbi:MAG TPA: DUF6800 family protein [Gemmataceae bacterium]|jgi:hypothetical protein|nr:DUF6800 family protein [Gemmataceae bacterium]
MVERRSELTRRYHRKKKMLKLKRKLALAKTEPEKAKILKKIHFLSPEWKEPAVKK